LKITKPDISSPYKNVLWPEWQRMSTAGAVRSRWDGNSSSRHDGASHHLWSFGSVWITETKGRKHSHEEAAGPRVPASSLPGPCRP